MSAPDNTPTEGVTRCDCGSKYWDGNVCHSCGERYSPSEGRLADERALQSLTNAIVWGNGW